MDRGEQRTKKHFAWKMQRNGKLKNYLDGVILMEVAIVFGYRNRFGGCREGINKFYYA